MYAIQQSDLSWGAILPLDSGSEVDIVAAERIPIPELKKKLETSKKLVIVDVREAKEIAEGGAIPGAIHIPMGQIEKRMSELPKSTDIVFY